MIHKLLIAGVTPWLLFTSIVSGAQGDRDSNPLLLLKGREIYRKACLACHGEKGDGQGPGSQALRPLPRDFTSGLYKFRSTPSGALPTDEDLLRTISRGIPGTAMPAWEGILAEEDRRAVIAYLKTLVPQFTEEPPETPIPIPEPTPPTSETVAEGQQIYLLMKCWECHGPRGRGNGPSARTLKDDWGHRIRAYDFTRGNYKGGSAPSDIFRTFRTGLMGTPMPAFDAVNFLFARESFPDLSPYEQRFSAAEVAALKAYLADQPAAQEIEAISEEEKASLANRRAWSLVHYVLSLSRGKGLFYRLLIEDPEATRAPYEPD